MPDIIKNEIWVNDDSTLSNEGPVEYSVVLDGEEIYVGYDIDTTEAEAVNLGSIFEDYLECNGLVQPLDDDSAEEEPTAYRCFEIYENGELTKTLCFLRSYDRSFGWDGGSCCLSNPINGRLDPRMQILHTDYKANTGETIDFVVVPVVKITPSHFNISAGAQVFTFDVAANCSYTASTSDGWITVYPSSGHSGITTFEVEVEGNIGTERSGSITISYYDEYGSIATKTVSINQAQTVLRFSPLSQTLDAYGENGSLTVTADGPYHLTPQAEWLTLSAYSGDSGTTTFTVIPETNYQMRLTRFTRITVGLGGNAFVSQRPAVITASPLSITAPPTPEGPYQFEVTSNIPYTLSSYARWVSFNESTGTTGTTQFEVYVENSTASTERRAAILVNTSNLAQVIQYPLTITVEPNSFDVPHSGGTYAFTVRSNGSYDISSDSWITPSAVSGGSGTTQFTLTVQNNPDYSGRTGYITIGNQTVTVTQQEAPQFEYLTFDILTGGTINWGLINTTSSSRRKSISYSLDSGLTWTQTLSSADTTINVSAGDTIMFKGIGQTYEYNSFTGSTAFFNVKGNLASLSNNLIVSTDAFSYLFCGTNVIDASLLIVPSGGLTTRCFSNLFRDCTNLVYPPALPATELASSCYSQLFRGCVSLAYAPQLPATALTNSCYSSMFSGCASLTSAPQLPATTLAAYCYNSMFSGCTSLVSVQSILPATTLANYCYAAMFHNCSSLTTAPQLPATALTNSCYNSMFRYCHNLTYIKCLATDISATSCLSNWVNGVSATGTFVKDPNMTSWPSGDSGIPNGWAVQDA